MCYHGHEGSCAVTRRMARVMMTPYAEDSLCATVEGTAQCSQCNDCLCAVMVGLGDYNRLFSGKIGSAACV